MGTIVFTAPTRIVAGLGAVGQLGAELARIGAERVAVVCDRGVADAGLLESIIGSTRGPALETCGLVDPDPEVSDAERVADAALAYGSDTVVAIGGGSALGVGKAVALRLTNPGPIAAYADVDRAPALPAPVLAVPTTAGSGSEVSNALVLRDPGRVELLVVRGAGYEPRTALLDGELLRALPHRAMLEAALDALSHALESLWAREASRFTDAFALRAAGDVYDTLDRALEQRRPGDLQTLLEASTMANLACGNARLGLVHALSSAAAVRLAHGYQNGVLLPHVAAFNEPALGRAARPAVDRLADLYEALPFDASFAPGDLDAADTDGMVEAALLNPFSANNVRPAEERDLRRILAAAGAPSNVGVEAV
jgi:alcohol dehydrogenase class IV